MRVFSEWERRASARTWDPEATVFQEALGALAEWRSSLLFLARLDSESAGSVDNGTLYLNAPEQDVIDEFFLHVTKGKRPTLGHRMLAHLSPLLRIETILTVNFDELLEQAFETVRMPLSVYDVHLSSGLPPLTPFRAAPSLIKMHGSRYSLRADYSLDSMPTGNDQRQFERYFTTSLATDHEPHKTFHSHLLVVGCSATDRHSSPHQACIGKVAEQFKVFWVCYRVDEIHAVIALANGVANGDWAPRCCVLRPTDLGLLFWRRSGIS